MAWNPASASQRQYPVHCGTLFCRDDAKLERLLGNVEGEVLTEPTSCASRPDSRRRKWYRNGIAIGLSGGFMEPLGSTSIHLIQRAVLRPDPDDAPQRDQRARRGRVQRPAGRGHTADPRFHRSCTIRRPNAATACSGGNAPRCRSPIRSPRRSSCSARPAGCSAGMKELFAENSWVQVMMGQGIMPRSHHPIAAKLRDDELDTLLGSDPRQCSPHRRLAARARRLCSPAIAAHRRL